MGEIKSTLDLVMEKTRHMTMSREERNAHIAEENRKKIGGLIQKYTDGLLRKEQFLEQFGGLNEIAGQSNRKLLLQEGLDRIGLEGTPDALLELLAISCGVDVKPLTEVLEEYQAKKQALEAERTDGFRQKMAAEHQISGSAVWPNLPMDPGYVEAVSGLQDEYSQRLQKEKSGLSG